MATTNKTWAAVYNDLAETMRKWDVHSWSITAQLQGKRAEKRFQTQEERTVQLTFKKWIPGHWRPATLTMRARDRSLDNLHALQQAVELMRLADVREVTKLVVLLEQQLYPQAPVAPPPQVTFAPLPEHYRVLGVHPEAPHVVVEAAYKALARQSHPDAGGSTAKMQRLNLAIEQIRKERGHAP